MIVTEENVHVDRSAGLNESAFAMDATSSAFDILSSGLYSDKPKAVIRELACNAHDSHVAAGYPTRPIEMHLPSSLDLTFYVKDYGTGLTDYEVRGGWYKESTGEQISDLDATMSAEDYIEAGYVRSTGIYNTYFRSTKTKSNDFIGQLGLGSKSPFSYASTFNVESRKDGKLYLYTCYKNEDGKPVITLMGVQDTTDENGITISMAVRRDDVEKFKAAARSALMYFNPQPDVRGMQGFKPYDMVHTVKGDKWRIRQAEYYAHMSGPYVVQGFVAYPVDIDLLVEGGLTGAAALLAQTNIDLYVPIGAARPAASREALQYDRRTVVNLIAAMNEAAGELRQSFQADFDKCTNDYEAAVLYDKFSTADSDAFRKLFNAFDMSESFKWKGNEIKRTLKIDLLGVKNTIVHRVGKTRRGKRTLNSQGMWYSYSVDYSKFYELPIQSNIHFIYSDKPSGTNTQLREYVDSLPEVDKRPAQLFIVKPQDKKTLAETEAARDKIAKQLGVTFKHINTVPPATKTVRSSGGGGGGGGRRTKTSRLVWNGFTMKSNYWGRSEVHRKFSRACYVAKEIALADGGLYLPISGFHVYTPSHLGNYFDDFLKVAVSEGFIKSTEIVAMNTKELEAAQAAGGKWINAFDFIAEQFKNSSKVALLPSGQALSQIQSQTTAMLPGLAKLVKAIKADDTVDNQWYQFFDRYDELVKAAGKMSAEDVKKFAKYASVSVDSSALTKQFVADWKDLLAAYPLLRSLQWELVVIDTKAVQEIARYVKLVDNAEKSTDTDLNT